MHRLLLPSSRAPRRAPTEFARSRGERASASHGRLGCGRSRRETNGRKGYTTLSRSTATSIDEYIAEFPPETQKVLEELRALIKAEAPDATETISYAIPTFDLNGRHLVHFAAFAQHIGFYPTGSGVEAFREELKPYKSGRGSVQFPLGEPMPADLIRRIVRFKIDENTRKTSRGRG